MLDNITYDYSKTCAYIYQITFDKNGYIGSTINPRERMLAHMTNLRHDRHSNTVLQNAWNKYGEDSFKFKIIDTCSIGDRNTVEEFYINKSNYNSNYNIQSNCNEPILRISKNRKLNINDIKIIFDKINNGDSIINTAKEFHMSKELIRSIVLKKYYRLESKSLFINWDKYKIDRGKNKSKALRKLYKNIIYMWDLSGNLLQTFSSIADAVEKTGYTRSNLTNSLYRSNTHDNKIFTSINVFPKIPEKFQGSCIRIIEFDNSFNKINMFKSMVECGKYYNIKSNTINSNCNRLIRNTTTNTYFVREYQENNFRNKYNIA